MIPWTLLFTLAQEAAPVVVPEIKRLYNQWKEGGKEPTQAEWDALLGKIADNSFRKILDEEAAKAAVT
jgi:hypothetical protein